MRKKIFVKINFEIQFKKFAEKSYLPNSCSVSLRVPIPRIFPTDRINRLIDESES